MSILNRYSFILTLALAILTGGAARSQATIDIWRAELFHANPDASPKLLFAALIDQLPTADVEHERDGNMLTLITEDSIEVNWLETTVASTGFFIVGLWLNGVDVYGGGEGEGLPPDESQQLSPGTSSQPSNE